MKSEGLRQIVRRMALLLSAALFAACASAPPPVQRPPMPRAPETTAPAASARPAGAGAVMTQAQARWVAADWSELPGWQDDRLFEFWNAWLKGCERPPAAWVALCPQVRRLSIADEAEQRRWMLERLQPYRVESLQGESRGLLTAYFEPTLDAQREPGPGFTVPVYAVPAGLASRKPWFSRQEIDTLPAAQAALADKVLMYLADPVDALLLQIQGSGRVRLAQADGSVRTVRLAYAGSNDQPYRSVGRWLLDQGLIKDASWPGIRAWLAQNPQRQQELLWSNPRVVFFREEALSDLDAAFGPRGAQGVALTPGRSIAVDPAAIPYGTPVWLASEGPMQPLQKLVMAQDTGSAITGAVRADYFVGWGADAGALAGRLRQTLQMWILWPK
ncbi:MltA domain-containing protein [Curvibacter sp. APW13]|uniref:murein transglycosylase A n=1 Tax=Curvibacter sp. APW13 TaxID=3077236 RepID=UPI0028DDE65F|nr:MltA domain-containing protein [Curvibacter sp. APW13]MDT8990124.1 MltA domain-containing protein [Curvibacter sp. APW13]